MPPDEAARQPGTVPLLDGGTVAMSHCCDFWRWTLPPAPARGFLGRMVVIVRGMAHVFELHVVCLCGRVPHHRGTGVHVEVLLAVCFGNCAGHGLCILLCASQLRVGIGVVVMLDFTPNICVRVKVADVFCSHLVHCRKVYLQ